MITCTKVSEWCLEDGGCYLIFGHTSFSAKGCVLGVLKHQNELGSLSRYTGISEIQDRFPNLNRYGANEVSRVYGVRTMSNEEPKRSSKTEQNVYWG